MCVCICDTDGINKKKKKIKKRKREFSYVCMQNSLIYFLGDPHLSSIDSGRGAPVGCMFQI